MRGRVWAGECTVGVRGGEAGDGRGKTGGRLGVRGGICKWGGWAGGEGRHILPCTTYVLQFFQERLLYIKKKKGRERSKSLVDLIFLEGYCCMRMRVCSGQPVLPETCYFFTYAAVCSLALQKRKKKYW